MPNLIRYINLLVFLHASTLEVYQVVTSSASTNCFMDKTIVIDNGSEMIKAGVAGEDFPRALFPSVVGRPRHFGVEIGLKNGFCVGKEAIRKRGILSLRYPIERGVVNDWDNMEKIWHHTLDNELDITSREHPILLTEAPFNSRENREKLTQIMFETFNVPAMFLTLPAVLSLYANGLLSGVVLDSGRDVTHSIPIYEGCALPYAISRSNIGGRDLIDYLVKLCMKNIRHLCSCGKGIGLFLDVRDKLAYVAQDFETELKSARKNPSLFEKEYILPCRHSMIIGSERFCHPEALFRPSLSEIDAPGVHEMTLKSIMNCDRDLREQMFRNIVLCGGSTLFPGFESRFTQEIISNTMSTDFSSRLDLEITGCRAPNKKVKVLAPLDRRYSAWKGGSILASLGTFTQMCITKAEYLESGPSIINKKCF